MQIVSRLASIVRSVLPHQVTPLPRRLTGYSVPPEKAREILRAEGCWPVRPNWWDRDEADSDFYVHAAFADLLESYDVFQAALASYLR